MPARAEPAPFALWQFEQRSREWPSGRRPTRWDFRLPVLGMRSTLPLRTAPISYSCVRFREIVRFCPRLDGSRYRCALRALQWEFWNSSRRSAHTHFPKLRAASPREGDNSRGFRLPDRCVTRGFVPKNRVPHLGTKRSQPTGPTDQPPGSLQVTSPVHETSRAPTPSMVRLRPKRPKWGNLPVSHNLLSSVTNAFRGTFAGKRID
jgi:hypothetical protein